jgi:hypothetical protein
VTDFWSRKCFGIRDRHLNLAPVLLLPCTVLCLYWPAVSDFIRIFWRLGSSNTQLVFFLKLFRARSIRFGVGYVSRARTRATTNASLCGDKILMDCPKTKHERAALAGWTTIPRFMVRFFPRRTLFESMLHLFVFEFYKVVPILGFVHTR